MSADPNPVAVQKTAYWAKNTWIVILVLAGALEAYGVVHPAKDDTLSEVSRWIWRTDTFWGKWLFRLFWAAFALWFGPHIVKIERATARKMAVKAIRDDMIARNVRAMRDEVGHA
jgi:hypothetical protein